MSANRQEATLKSIVVILGFLAVVGAGGWAFAASPASAGPPGPPPEAFKACEGKKAGDTVQIQTPRGDTISGTCREMQGQLVAVPEGGPHGRRSGPPAEAFKACEGKNPGETVRIQTPRGDTISGTCRLVAVPQM